MKVKIEVWGEIELSYNPKSKEFKEALEGYKHSIVRDGTVDDMLEHVAFHITRFGIESMVEGVGYVGENGKKPDQEPYSGIMVGEDYDEFTFEKQ